MDVEKLARAAGAKVELVGEEANTKCGWFFEEVRSHREDRPIDTHPSLEAFAAAIRREALLEAAMVAQGYLGCRNIADAIRALAGDAR